MGTSSHPVPLSPAAACQDPFFSMPASWVPVHAWRVIRWETDVPLGDDETELLPEMLQNVFSMAGLCACSVPHGADHVVMLLAHTAFPAPVHADLAAWLCVYQLMDTFLKSLGKEGTVQISRAFQDRAAWESQELLPLADYPDAVKKRRQEKKGALSSQSWVPGLSRGSALLPLGSTCF